jgi:exo-1,4-beta-D-glucosaminidase
MIVNKSKCLLFALAALISISGLNSCQNQTLPNQNEGKKSINTKTMNTKPDFIGSMMLNENWKLQSSEKISDNGEQISSATYQTDGWYDTTVPSTVLAALVNNGVYKNIYFDRNLEKIPTQQFKKAWWYRKEFLLNRDPQNLKDDNKKENIEDKEYARLIFEGINYRANVWLNGKKIAGTDQLAGSFRIFEIDATNHLTDGKNILAVEVLPPRPGDFTIGFVDWNPAPPDQNMGIWREVKLRMNGAVSINHPFVKSDVNLETLDEVSLTVSTTLVNHTDQPVEGVLEFEIGDIKFNRDYSLKASETQLVSISPEQEQSLFIKNPRLWWPWHMGTPHLYSLSIKASIKARTGKQVSDLRQITFGIREIADYINEKGHRGYVVNGKKLIIRGGGWVDDLLLVEDEKKLEDQFRYVKHMNLNTVRLEGFWGSSKKLYDLADRYGILLMAGWSCHWEWAEYVGKPVDEFGGIKTPEEMELVAESLKDQVMWLRNHPSIFVWVVGSDKLPRPDLEKKYNQRLAKVDPTRPVLAACKYKVSKVSGPTAVKMAGPYDYVTPNYWYEDKKLGGAFGFNTETGPGPQPPPLESLKKMIPDERLWPINDAWNYHCGRKAFNSLKRYMNAFNHRYGKPDGVEDFTFKAQAANYEAMRAMFESFSVNRQVTTGLIQWMLNSAWPEMFWQLYDYYLMPNGAFYGTRVAFRPLNIIYNYGDGGVYVVNDTYTAKTDLKARARVFDSQSEKRFDRTVEIDLGEYQAVKVFDGFELKGVKGVYFVSLTLEDAGGETCADSFYWLSTKRDILDEMGSTWFVTPNKQYADLTGLNRLPEVEINVSPTFKTDENNNYEAVQVVLENPSDKIAFFIEMQVAGGQSGKTVLPVFWQDNYISLLPGETKTIEATFSPEDLHGEKPVLKWSGWNVKKRDKEEIGKRQ